MILAQPTPPELPTDVVPSGLTWGDWLQAGLIFVVAIVVAVLVRKLIQRAIDRVSTTPMVGRVIARLVAAVLVSIGLVYALSAIGVQVAPLLGALGIGTIALAFALQNSLENLVAGAILQMQRSLRIGDEIRASDHEGIVEDVSFQTVQLRTFDDERVIIPASSLLRSPILNRSAFPRRRSTLEVGVSYGTDLTRATDVLLSAVRSVDGVTSHPAPHAWATRFGESSIDFTLHFWHEAREDVTWRVRHGVCLAVERALEAGGITIPFPQRTLWFGPTDG